MTGVHQEGDTIKPHRLADVGGRTGEEGTGAEIFPCIQEACQWAASAETHSRFPLAMAPTKYFAQLLGVAFLRNTPVGPLFYL